MELYNLEKNKLKNKKKRIGRGRGSGKGGHTVGKGSKGQKARKGAKPRIGFEGGQTPLYKRLPKIGGFKSSSDKVNYIINLDVLNIFDDGDEVTPQILVDKGMLDMVPSGSVKILSDGDLKKKLALRGFKFSRIAKEKIEKSGSKIDA